VRDAAARFSRRDHDARAAGGCVHSPGFLPPEHYNQIFSAHGTIMIFFVAMPFVIGLMNLVVPLQLGVRDVASSDTQFGRLLVDCDRGAVRQRLARGRRVRAHGLAPYPVVELPIHRCRRRLLSLVAADIRRGTLVAGINLVTTC